MLAQFETVDGEHFYFSALFVVICESAHDNDHVVMHYCPVTASSCVQSGLADELPILIVKDLYHITFFVIRKHASTHHQHPIREETGRIQWVTWNSLQLIIFYSLTWHCGIENLKRIRS